MMRDVVREIKEELLGKVDMEYKEGVVKFFKESVNIMGVRTADTRKVARMYFPIVSDLKKEEIFCLCEKLLARRSFEENTVGLDWISRLKDQYTKADFVRFKKWFKKYVSNWAHCDDFCTHGIGILLEKYPELKKEVVEKWSKSSNRWFRRAATVSLIYVVRRGEILSDVYRVIDKLMNDKDDLVQKGMGWLLRETSDRYPSDVYRYVLKNRDKLPRITFRYAIEKMNKGQQEVLIRK